MIFIKKINHKPSAIRLLAAFLCFAALFASCPRPAGAYAKLPKSVRIGLYFDGAGAVNRAEPSYQVMGENGVSLGYSAWSGDYVPLYDFKNVSKDSPMTLMKYNFNSKYTVITGRKAKSFAELASRVAALREKGFSPLLFHIDGWVLVIGLYETKDAALKEIETRFKGKFTFDDFYADKLSGRYILIKIGDVVQFLFDRGVGYLRADPITKAGDDGKPAVIELNGKPYRGALEFNRLASGEMTAVNLVSLEDYLRGVAPREMGASSPIEALKAQAVAARTYALVNARKHINMGFGLCDGPHCQAYGGYAWEDERPSRAVDETAGQIVTYNGAPAQTLYFSSSGGRTEDAKYVWGFEYPYLTGVEDKYETPDTLNYIWETAYSPAEIKSRLAQNGVRIGDIRDVAVTKISENGRVIEVKVTGTEGEKIYAGGDCRTFLNNLHSQTYTVSDRSRIGELSASVGVDIGAVTGENAGASGGSGTNGKTGSNGGAGAASSGPLFYFTGKGWGHGVGMSQNGARGMANAGFTYKEILQHYYPGCVVE